MPSYEGWAILSLMGHNERYGWVRETEQFGTKMIQIDMPVGKDDAGQDITVSEFYGGPSIYSLRPCTEEIVRDHFARRWGDPRPARPLDYAPKQITRDSDDDPDDDESPF